MARLELPYGRGFCAIDVPDGRLKAVLAPEHVPAQTGAQEALVARALEHPIGSPRLAELAAGKRRVLVITSDHTRPVPSRVTTPPLLREIRAGSPDAEITILIATGMHRETTRAELRAKFGDEIADRERIAVHRADDGAQMAYFGTLPSGGELWLNRLVREADLVVAEGFIEPHFFAGFSGGRKSILPGVAARRTVLYNHNAAFIASENARQGVLAGNPIHEDMRSAAEKAGLRFILNVLIDGQKRVIAAVAGAPEEAHASGCALCARMTRVRGVTADIAVTTNGGYPLDQNVYQCVKGMTAAEQCVRPGGALILCAALGDGHGGEAFFRCFAENPDPRDILRRIERVPPEETRPDQWEAQILARVMCRATCFLVTGEENRALVEAMHLRWVPDPNAALAEATRMLGEAASVAVIPDGVGVIVERP